MTSVYKFRIQVLALMLTLAALCGCGGAATPAPDPVAEDSWESVTTQAPYRFGIGYSSAGYTEAFEQWRDAVFEATGGNVELILYGENVLGEGKDMLLAVQQGPLSIVAASTSVGTEIVPQAAVMDIPACFTEYSQPFQIYSGDFYQKLNAGYNEAGLELLFLRTGEPWIISSVEPITTLSQLNGMRIRTSGSPYRNRLYDLLGIQQVENVGLSGLAYILDENGVDGIETTYIILKSQNLLDAQPYGFKGPLFTMSSAIVMNYNAFYALPEDYQVILKTSLADILTDRQEQTDRIEEGIQVYTLSETERNALRDIATPLLDEIIDLVGAELVQALAEENSLLAQSE